MPIAVARQVIEEASRGLGEALPSAWAEALAARAEVAAAHTPGWRARSARSGDAGRESCYAFMRHWLVARLLAERPDLYAKLPERFSMGAPWPERFAMGAPWPERCIASEQVESKREKVVSTGDEGPLSPDARLLMAV